MPFLPLEPGFWMDLGQIMLVNIVLSGDNAVVIALAARSLPEKHRRQAILWGSIAAILMRIGLTLVALEMLRLLYLKMIGSVLLLWIAIKLLTGEEEGNGTTDAQKNVAAAIRTILIADIVMSLDNVLAVAAAAGGNNVLLIFGLGVSIPLVIFGSSFILKMMDRFPWIVTLGAAVLGYVSGEMFASEEAFRGIAALREDGFLHFAIPVITALLVVGLGRFIAHQKEAALLATGHPIDLVQTPAKSSAVPKRRKKRTKKNA